MFSTENLVGCSIMEFSMFVLVFQGPQNWGGARLDTQCLEYRCDNSPNLEVNLGLLAHSFYNHLKFHFPTFLPNIHP